MSVLVLLSGWPLDLALHELLLPCRQRFDAEATTTYEIVQWLGPFPRPGHWRVFGAGWRRDGLAWWWQIDWPGGPPSRRVDEKRCSWGVRRAR